MPELAVLLSPSQTHATTELVETIRYELALQGVPSTLHRDGFPIAQDGVVYLLAGPRQIIDFDGPDAVPDAEVLARTIVLSDERPGDISQGSDPYFELLRNAGVVFDTHSRSVRALHGMGIPARSLRPGYSRRNDRFSDDTERPIDILFYGKSSARRVGALSRFAPMLDRYNCLLAIGDERIASIEGAPSWLGASLSELSCLAKLVMNIHIDDQKDIEWDRLLGAVQSGSAFVTEHSIGLAPFEPGDHLLVGALDSLPHLAAALLDEPERLADMRRAAYDRLSRWVPFAMSIGVLRAAIVELVGRPVAADALYGRPFKPPADDWFPLPVTPAETPDAKSNRMAIEGMREQMKRLRVRIDRLDHEPDLAVQVDQRWSESHRMALSVCVAVSENDRRLATTLDSLVMSHFDHWELIVTAPRGSEVLETAEDWVEEHPGVPAVVSAVHPATNVAESRNLALRAAWSPLVLVLRPGEGLYSHGLERLVGTMQSDPTLDACYAMVDCRAPGEISGMGLGGIWDWRPSRLRIESWITSPYVIRREALESVGWFGEQPELEGVEDYDLFCRLGARGAHVSSLAQIIAFTSRDALASESALEGQIGVALIERSPSLLAGALRRR